MSKLAVTTDYRNSKPNYYRGMVFRVTQYKTLRIFEGYDYGSRVVYALSLSEFKRKANAWLDKGVTNQHAPRALKARGR